MMSGRAGKVGRLSRKLVLLGALAATLVLLLLPGTATSATRRSLSPPAALLRAINAARRAYGLAPLRIDRMLTDAARSHTLDMIRRDYFAHGDFAQRLTRFGAVGPTIGENLAWDAGPATPGFLVDAWLASPDHRANLLRPGFRRIGIGLARASFLGHAATTVVTTDFAGS
jgi:uncharacterized protein YkwD